MLHIKWLHLHLQICTKFKKMKEIFHKKILSENQIRGKMLLQFMYSLLIRAPLADSPEMCYYLCVAAEKNI